MKPWAGVFGSALGIAALLVMAFAVPEPVASHGLVHPELASMQRGGPGLERLGHALWLGFGLGLCEIALFVSLLGLGARGRGGLRGLGRPLLAGGLAYAAVWTALVAAYPSYAAGSDAVFLGFPLPTAWMLFALWPLPLVFVVLYVVGFDRWIAPQRDLADLARRLGGDDL